MTSITREIEGARRDARRIVRDGLRPVAPQAVAAAEQWERDSFKRAIDAMGKAFDSFFDAFPGLRK